MKIVASDLICPYCGEIITIQRKPSKSKSIGHIKDMYCPYCLKTRKFIEIVDRDKYYYELLYKEKLTDIEKNIFESLNKRKEKNKTYGKY